MFRHLSARNVCVGVSLTRLSAEHAETWTNTNRWPCRSVFIVEKKEFISVFSLTTNQDNVTLFKEGDSGFL